jgi:hypothetical protein
VSHKLCLKPIDGSINGLQESFELEDERLSVVKFNIFDRYIEGGLRIESHLVGRETASAFDFQPSEFVLTAEKITGDLLVRNDDTPWRRGRNSRRHRYGDCGNESKPPMTVKPCEVVDVFERRLKPTIRAPIGFSVASGCIVFIQSMRFCGNGNP